MLCALRVGELFIVLCPLARTDGSDLRVGFVCVELELVLCAVRFFLGESDY